MRLADKISDPKKRKRYITIKVNRMLDNIKGMQRAYRECEATDEEIAISFYEISEELIRIMESYRRTLEGGDNG